MGKQKPALIGKEKNNQENNKKKVVLVQQEKNTMTACHGSGWDRDNFLCRCLYDAMFWTCDENSGDNTQLF